MAAANAEARALAVAPPNVEVHPDIFAPLTPSACPLHSKRRGMIAMATVETHHGEKEIKLRCASICMFFL